MKLPVLLTALVIIMAGNRVFAQGTKIYTTSGGETIFSFATIEQNGSEMSSIVRFSPWFNTQSYLNIDVSPAAGFFTGLTVRNVGFIMDKYDDPAKEVRVKKKFRTYNLGIPFGLKLGNMNKTFIYGGYEFELPFNYKEKTFENEKKTDKFNVWFSDRVEFQHGAFFGIQMPYGGNIKFKYYFSNFHNQDYTETVDGKEVKPYAGLKANVFYFSLNFDMFKGKKFSYSDGGGKKSGATTGSL